MSQRRQARYMKRALYRLKREYGFKLTLQKASSEVLNYETGERTTTIVICKIERAIVLPVTLQSKFEFDLAYTAANRNFTYGGDYNTSLRKIIIDADDLVDFEIEINDFFIFQGRRWQVSKIQEFELEIAFIITGKEVKGTPRYMIEEFALEDLLSFTEAHTQT